MYAVFNFKGRHATEQIQTGFMTPVVLVIDNKHPRMTAKPINVSIVTKPVKFIDAARRLIEKNETQEFSLGSLDGTLVPHKHSVRIIFNRVNDIPIKREGFVLSICSLEKMVNFFDAYFTNLSA